MTSTINREKKYDDFTSAFGWAFEQHMKAINTALPGIINSIDLSTRRAQIQPALNQIKTDGTTIELPVLVDVPILMPQTKNYLISLPLEAGDSVMLLFSQRGLAQFKASYEQSLPSQESFFSIHDAVAIPAFGALSSTPADSNALTLQTTDGMTYLSLKPNDITLKATTVTVEGELIITGSTTAQATSVTTLSLGGSTLPPNHRHGGVQSGGDTSGTPVP